MCGRGDGDTQGVSFKFRVLPKIDILATVLKVSLQDYKSCQKEMRIIAKLIG